MCVTPKLDFKKSVCTIRRNEKAREAYHYQRCSERYTVVYAAGILYNSVHTLCIYNHIISALYPLAIAYTAWDLYDYTTDLTMHST